jgi:putative NIF3 family GTP cyclohydrolase 1 type 2
VNNLDVKEIKTIGFCAGSGSEFLDCTEVDCFVTGDLKYHTACEAKKVVFDIGHFESEVLIKEKFSKILGIEGVMADEKTPFI